MLIKLGAAKVTLMWQERRTRYTRLPTSVRTGVREPYPENTIVVVHVKACVDEMR